MEFHFITISYTYQTFSQSTESQDFEIQNSQEHTISIYLFTRLFFFFFL